MPVFMRIIVNLTYIIWRHLYFPLSVLWKKGYGLIMMVIAGFVIYLFMSPDGSSPPHAYITQTGAQGEQLMQPILRFEDGNSAFASDLIPMMNRDELVYYSQLFYWIMDHQTVATPYQWNQGTMHGSMVIGKDFTNNIGNRCRSFSETLKVRDTQQEIEGIACQQRGGGWCKLRKNSTPACDLGRKAGIRTWWSDTRRSVGNLF